MLLSYTSNPNKLKELPVANISNWMFQQGLLENENTFWKLRRTLHSPWIEVVIYPRKATPVRDERSGSKFRITGRSGGDLPDWLQELLLPGKREIGASTLYDLHNRNLAQQIEN